MSAKPQISFCSRTASLSSSSPLSCRISIFPVLGLLPKLFHLLDRGLAEILAPLGQPVLDPGEAGAEFRVGAAQRLLGVDAEEAGGVHNREQQVADFFLDFFRRRRFAGVFELGDFLTHFLENAPDFRPIEPGRRGLFGQMQRFHQRRLVPQHSVEQPLLCFAPLALFFGLDLVPALEHLLGSFCIAAREHVRVAPHQLGVDRVERILDGEVPRLGRHLRVKHRLEHEIAELLGQRAPVAAVDGVQHLVRLFERVRLDRVERLLPVPRAAAFAAKARHDLDEALELLARAGAGPFLLHGGETPD